MRKAIIGGTGVYNLEGFNAGSSAAAAFHVSKVEARTVVTEYGDVDVDILSIEAAVNTDGKHAEKVEDAELEIVFLARHGRDHAVPPHLINYRANMMALKLLEVDEVFATCAVGSMRDDFGLGEVVLLKDFMDFTKTRIQTYFDGSVKHVIMSSPYCRVLAQSFKDVAKKTGIALKGEAIYVCTEGPRFETASEIAMYRQLGGDVVGMTNVPECVLAKELGMCYSAVGIVTNWCTGIKPEVIALHDIGAALSENKERVTASFINIFISEYRSKKACENEKQLAIKNPDGCNLEKPDGCNLEKPDGCNCARSLISL